MSDFIKRLDKALDKAVIRYNSPSLNESIRKFHFKVSKVLTEGRKEDGIYYWLPDSDGAWRVEPFPFRFYGDVDHATIWDKYVVQHLAMTFRVPTQKLTGLHIGLPRGRIAKMDGNYVIYHGDDSPDDLDKVFSTFNLDKSHDVAKYFSHETMSMDDYVKLCEVIGRDLGLKPLPESERWTREDED